MKYPVYLFVIVGFLAGKTWLDLWQPDAFGHYDTAENCLQGYQYTDNHVKVQPECVERWSQASSISPINLWTD
jgi:hypothetical protein